MPMYEFHCLECDEGFEIECHMAEREEKSLCPHCGSQKVEAVLTGSFMSPRPSTY
jgi:putative FmdB family regulatory protein